MVLCLLLCALATTAQAAIGAWRSHFAYHNATQCAVMGGKVYVVSDGSLYSYTPSDEYVEAYDKTNLLSDQGVRHIAVDEQTNRLVVVYDNANIDFIYPDGSITNLADYASETTLDPMINDLCIENGKAYLATNFGLTVLDVRREEFGNSYTLGRVTRSCVELGGIIYAATAEGLYSGDTRKNLLDISNWEKMSEEVYSQLATFDGCLMGLNSDQSVYRIFPTDSVPELFRKGPLNFLHRTDGKLIVGNRTNVWVYSSQTSSVQLSLDGTVNYLVAAGSTYWTCNGAKGLNAYTYDKSSRKATRIVGEIAPNSPVRNLCQYLNFVDDSRLLVAGGCLNYFGTTFYDGTLMMYEEGEWKTFEEGINQKTGIPYKNLTSIVQDPKDATHHYASSFGQGIYEFRDMKFVKLYTHTDKPGSEMVVASPLESAIPESYEYTRISRLQYDKQGNLWISNAGGADRVDSPLKIMKPDGTFVNLYYEELQKLPTVTEVLFGSNGWLWVVSMQKKVRLFCIDTNGTLEDTSDDRVRKFDGRFMDQDGGIAEVDYINDIAEDHNGNLWVMTSKGPFVLYDIDEAFNSNYHFTKIKVPRNDGTNYADYLLDGAYTTCVEIDAANRKWIGTRNNGLYLISDDGLETIHHFTRENSPLPSNTIESLALHHASGELFVGTDKGLMSYMSDATRAEQTYDETKVYAYPNPMTADYDGPVTVVGLKANSQVKITNTAGHLVAEGTSLGGSFTWNGRTSHGQRVSTGVYYVLGCDDEGTEGIVTKILVVK